MPVDIGSVTLSAAATATAASAAFPPISRILIPALEARGCVQHTMPLVEYTALRLAVVNFWNLSTNSPSFRLEDSTCAMELATWPVDITETVGRSSSSGKKSSSPRCSRKAFTLVFASKRLVMRTPSDSVRWGSDKLSILILKAWMSDLRSGPRMVRSGWAKMCDVFK